MRRMGGLSLRYVPARTPAMNDNRRNPAERRRIFESREMDANQADSPAIRKWARS